jgi:chromosome segregation ATPase
MEDKMIQEILKNNGLNEDQITNILNSMKESKVYTTKHENIDERYNKLKTQKTELEAQIKERDTQLADLSKNNKDNEGLLNQIKDLQALNKQTTTDYENKINQMQFDYALEGALTNAKSKNNKALKALLDMNSIKYQEGKLEGLQERIEALKNDASYLFDLETAPVNTGGIGNFSRGNNSIITKEQFRSMSYMEKMNLYNENKDLFNQLNNN